MFATCVASYKGVAMISFQVSDMTCGHCVKAITSAIQAIAPTAAVVCDVDTKSVTVNSSIEPSKIEQVIREAGYTPVRSS